MELQILNKNNEILAAVADEVDITFVYKDCFHEGDKIRLSIETPGYFVVQLDDTMKESIIYIKTNTWEFIVPLTEDLKNAYSLQAFKGNLNYIRVRKARDFEIKSYRNLALNSHDQNGNETILPHIYANVETRNDATFFARNVIDGIHANDDHGNYPYHSWGINQQQDAQITLQLTATAKVDCIGIRLRSDFPHDSYWEEITIVFSDETQEIMPLCKTDKLQFINITPREIEWLTLKNLKKHQDDSPFPALTELEVYGRVL